MEKLIPVIGVAALIALVAIGREAIPVIGRLLREVPVVVPDIPSTPPRPKLEPFEFPSDDELRAFNSRPLLRDSVICKRIEWQQAVREEVKNPVWAKNVTTLSQLSVRLQEGVEARLEDLFTRTLGEVGPVTVTASVLDAEINLQVDTPCGEEAFKLPLA